MADRCRWVLDDKIGLYHLPGCWSAVVGDPEDCTCEGVGEDDPMNDRLASMEARLSELEQTIRSLKGDEQ